MSAPTVYGEICKSTIKPIMAKPLTAKREKKTASEKVRKSKRRKRASLWGGFGHSGDEGTSFYFQIHHPL